ncbi:hypothetical protein ACS126_03780 [Sphingobacterium lactis]|uniref:hypothetical protein n=1 Tax=Sphingobacterium TaxID=28453 RepID=UPI0021A2B90E|nr:hypothetical protein [Sphingobacterium hotanense]MCT1525304.1 hypothetical protein [Sphingobacterium hotanense]
MDHNKLITVNSISGGRTSSFMALHFKADHNIFACVEQEHIQTTPEGRRMRDRNPYLLPAQNWLRRFNPGFWATAEDDRTIIALHRLTHEMKTGEHDYYRGAIEVVFAHNYGDSRYDTFDKIVTDFLPNSRKRICTEMLKVYPIYRYLKRNVISGDRDEPTQEPIQMRIGFRLDEVDRTVNLYFRLVNKDKRVPDPSFDLQSVINRFGIPNYIVTWWDRMDVEGMVRRGERVLKSTPFNEYDGDYYRIPSFPLIEAGITNAEIIKYWSGRPEYDFPPISNCVMCFHHRVKQLQMQWADPINISQMRWAAKAEATKGHSFLKNFTMEQIRDLPLQLELEFSDFTGCDSGSCTD